MLRRWEGRRKSRTMSEVSGSLTPGTLCQTLWRPRQKEKNEPFSLKGPKLSIFNFSFFSEFFFGSLLPNIFFPSKKLCVILLYSKSLFCESTLKITKKLRGRSKWPSKKNPGKSMIYSSCILETGKCWRAHCSSVSYWLIFCIQNLSANRSL